MKVTNKNRKKGCGNCGDCACKAAPIDLIQLDTVTDIEVREHPVVRTEQIFYASLVVVGLFVILLAVV